MRKGLVSSVALGLAWLASLAVVYVLGLFTSLGFYRAPGPGEASTQMEPRLAALVTEYLGPEAAEAAASSGLEPYVQPLLTQLAETDDPAQRAYHLRTLLQRLSVGEVATAADAWWRSPRLSPHAAAISAALFERWAVLDQRSALAYAMRQADHSQFPELLRAVHSGWAQENPAQAWANLRDHAQVSYRPAQEAVLTHLAASDPALATRNLAESQRDIQPELAAQVSRHLYARYGAEHPAVWQWIQALPAPANRAAAHGLLYTWVDDDPQSLLNQLPQRWSEGAELRFALFQRWAEADFHAARRYLDSVGDPDLREKGTLRVTESWLDWEGPGPVAAWLSQQPVDEHWGYHARLVALASLDYDPEAALHWAQAIPEEWLRSETIMDVIHFSQPDLSRAETPEPQEPAGYWEELPPEAPSPPAQ